MDESAGVEGEDVSRLGKRVEGADEADLLAPLPLLSQRRLEAHRQLGESIFRLTYLRPRPFTDA